MYISYLIIIRIFPNTLQVNIPTNLLYPFNRKKCLLYGNILSLLAALCMGLCQFADIYGLLVLGRFLIGIYGGELTWSTNKENGKIN